MTLPDDGWYVFTTEGVTSRPLKGAWAELYLADLKARGKSGTMRRVPAPPPYVAPLERRPRLVEMWRGDAGR